MNIAAKAHSAKRWQAFAGLALLLLVIGCQSAHAQLRPIENFGRVLTNSEVPADTSFTIVLIHGGDQDPYATKIANWIQGPSVKSMAAWSHSVQFSPIFAGSELVHSKYAALMQKHHTFPIIALQETSGESGEGAIWWSTSPNYDDFPKDESQLAGSLSMYYRATLAAKQQGPQSLQGGTRLRDDGPSPYNPVRPRRPPLINPKVDVDHDLNLPTTLDTSVNATLDPNTRQAIYVTGGVLFASAAMLSLSLFMSALAIAFARTKKKPKPLTAAQTTAQATVTR